MHRVRWRIILPIFQLLLAVVLFVYSFAQYRAVIRAVGGGVGLEFHERHWPPTSERLSRAINFPVTAVMVPLNFVNALNRWQYEYQNKQQEYWVLTAYDGIYFVGVSLLWYWIGKRIDEFSWKSRPIETGVAFLLGASCLALTSYCLFSSHCPPPFKQIVTCGLIWAVALLGYACLQVQRSRNPRDLVK